MLQRVISSLFCVVLLFLADSPAVVAKVFLDGDVDIGAQELSKDVKQVMDEVTGCGAGGDTAEDVAAIERFLLPTWRTLPKNAFGRVGWKVLRYVAHRYFVQQSSLVVRGFEPSLPVNNSHANASGILSQVPLDLLLSHGNSDSGYSLEDAAAFLVAIKRLVFDSEAELLEWAYRRQHREFPSTARRSTHKQLQTLIETYLVRWLMDEESAVEVLNDFDNLENTIPHWRSLREFVEGRIRILHFQRMQAPRVGHGHSLMLGAYSFSDAHEVVGGITQSFQSFWQSECVAMKEQLITMDPNVTGRVSLANFYGDGSDEQWTFAESRAYLRDLGALDESSPQGGVRVIIPNYLQAASNCIMSGSHYLVCCANDCEGIMAEIEKNVRAPLATPEQILSVVDPFRAVEDEMNGVKQTVKRRAVLAEQLDRVAAMHGGEVPLHSRLFAQWLHYVFPRECPFPHKAGAFAAHTLTTSAYGMESAVASEREMRKCVAEGRRQKLEELEAALKDTARSRARRGRTPVKPEVFALDQVEAVEANRQRHAGMQETAEWARQKLAAEEAQQSFEGEATEVSQLEPAAWTNVSHMTQWSYDEELFADYGDMVVPLEVPSHTAFHMSLLVATASALVVSACITGRQRPRVEKRKVHRV